MNADCRSKNVAALHLTACDCDGNEMKDFVSEIKPNRKALCLGKVTPVLED